MFKALNQFFAALESIFRAFTNLAQAGENVTEWAKDETGFFNHKANLERSHKIVLLNADNAKAAQALGITAPATTPAE